MSIEEARPDFIEAQELLSNRWPVEVLVALDTCIREIARDEYGKISPAPVGEDGPDADKDMLGEIALAASLRGKLLDYQLIEAIASRLINAGYQRAPTPPAKDTEGEAGAAAIHETISYMTAKAAESGDLRQRLADAHADARAAWDCCEVRRKEAADLEARLAEAERRAIVEKKGAWAAYLANAQANTRTEAAERALADATKRIEALEAGLALAANRLDLLGVGLVPGSLPYIQADEWVREARALLSPASEGAPSNADADRVDN